MLKFLDLFFTVFHTSLVLFVLIGWCWPKTRKSHFIVLVMVIFAWVVIGWYVGALGYCPLTDWHWDIKRALGERGMPSSYIEYILERWTGIDFPRKLVDAVTLFGLLFAFGAASFFKIRSLLGR